MDNATIRLSGIAYRYPGAAAESLVDVDVSLDGGLVLVGGASGGGKSTLLRLLCGLVPHLHGGRLRGSARVAGLDVARSRPAELGARVGYLFQDPECQTVRGRVAGDVAFGLENRAVAPAEISRRVDEALVLCGVDHLRDRRVATLSGGERQRVALAGVLVTGPALLALDEPAAQLDAGGRSDLIAVLRRLRDSGTGIVLAEHRFDGLRGIADSSVVIRGGRLHTGPIPRVPAPQRPAARAPGDLAWRLDGVSIAAGGRSLAVGITAQGCAGEVVALTGANGSGKTTLLRTLAGLQRPLAGAIWLRPGRRVAHLPQNPAALLHLPSVAAELEYTRRRADCDTSSADERMVDGLGLRDLLHRYPRDLSCGQRQRAAVAAVLAGAPDLVLLDEPTRGMDAAARAAMVEVILALRERGAGVILATHDEDLVVACADRRLQLRGGTLIDTGEPRAAIVPGLVPA